MPKPMTITVEVEEIAFGKVFRTLDGMEGVVSINLTGSGPKPVKERAPWGSKTKKVESVAPKKPRSNDPVTSKNILFQALSIGPQHINTLSKKMEENGKSPHTTRGQLHKFKEQGWVQSDVGVYTLTPKGIAENSRMLESRMLEGDE